jgi:hypothetical protein
MGRSNNGDLEPSNDRELEIVRAVNQLSREGRLDPHAISEIESSLDFKISAEERKFLVNYIRWRIDKPAEW